MEIILQSEDIAHDLTELVYKSLRAKIPMGFSEARVNSMQVILEIINEKKGRYM